MTTKKESEEQEGKGRDEDTKMERATNGAYLGPYFYRVPYVWKGPEMGSSRGVL